MTQHHPIQNEEIMLITTNVADRKPVFKEASYAREAIETIYRVQQLHPFLLYGFVFMPDHCHFLLRVPPPETISKIMNVYKSGVTFNTGLPQLWQRRFHMRIPEDAEEALNYIHLNPVKAELATEPEDYPWSSASGRWDVTPLDAAPSAPLRGCALVQTQRTPSAPLRGCAREDRTREDRTREDRTREDRTREGVRSLGTGLRSQFPILRESINGYPLTYLDNAATIQKPQCVIDAISEFYARDNANVKRGMHELAERATEIYEAARERVREFVNARSSREIVFTKNATEGINLVARSWGEANLRKGDVLLLSLLEHHSNIVPWLQLRDRFQKQKTAPYQYTSILISPDSPVPKNAQEREHDIEIAWIGIEKDGSLKTTGAEKILKTGKVKLMCITCVSNVLGIHTKYVYLTHLAHKYGALVLLDASQLASHRPIDVQGIGCDFLVFSGHKVYGPTGIGVLYGREELLNAMPPFLGGGTMIQEVTTDRFTPASLPEKFEAGTPPIAEARGLHVALDWLTGLGWGNVRTHEEKLLGYALKKLSALPFVEVLGPKDPAKIVGCISFVCRTTQPDTYPSRRGLAATGNLTPKTSLHPHDLTEYLGRRGVCLRAGHHCTQPLHDFLGHPATTRMSVAVYNTKEEIDRMCEVIGEAYAFFTGE